MLVAVYKAPRPAASHVLPDAIANPGVTDASRQAGRDLESAAALQEAAPKKQKTSVPADGTQLLSTAMQGVLATCNEPFICV